MLKSFYVVLLSLFLSQLSYAYIYLFTDISLETCGKFDDEYNLVEKLPSPYKCIEESAPSFDVEKKVFTFGDTVYYNWKKYELPKEVLDLPKDAIITQEMYDKYGTLVLALSLTQRKARLDSHKDSGTPFYDYYKNAEVIMAFNAVHIDSIKEKGFLNFHQLGKSNGCGYCGESRFRGEGSRLGVRLAPAYDSKMDKNNPNLCLNPKYSFCVPTVKKENHSSTRLVEQYGELHAVFKPYNKKRCTFTKEDSLGIRDDFNQTYTFYSRSQENITANNPWSTYMETQIQGPLTFDDVDYFLVNCPDYYSSRRYLSNESLEKLKSIGKPIYKCESDGWFRAKKGELIFEPEVKRGLDEQCDFEQYL